MENLYDCCPRRMQLPFHIAKMKAPLPIGEKQLYKNSWKYWFYKHCVGVQWTWHCYIAATTNFQQERLHCYYVTILWHLMSGTPSSGVMTGIATSLTWLLLWSPQLNFGKLHIIPVIKSRYEMVTGENTEHLSYCQTNITAESLRTQIKISAQKRSI